MMRHLPDQRTYDALYQIAALLPMRSEVIAHRQAVALCSSGRTFSTENIHLSV